MMNRLSRLLVLSAALAAFSAAAQYPGKPVRIVVPFSAGGTTDILARAVGQKLTAAWSQPIVIDNRPGASGMIGAEIVAKAPPDGYTVLMASVAEVAINQSLYARMTYDPLKDLAPVTLAGFTPLILVVHPSVQARSVKELIGLAKAKPGRFTFASPGNGSVQHLSGELMKTVARVDITHVPYKGGAPAVTDLVGGQISMFFAGMPIVMPHVKAGRLRALAVTVTKRSPAAPDVPTMEEAGVPGFDISNWFGVYVPAATPKAVIAKLNSEMSRVLNLADVKERLAEQGLETVGNSVEQFDAFFRAEVLKYASLQLGVFDQVVDRPGSRPAEAVQSGIHHQPTGPVGFGAQASEARIRVGIKTKVFSEPLRVECPAFAVARVAVVAADLGQRLDLHGARRLQVMAGDRLMQKQRVHRPARPGGEIVHVGLQVAGT